MRTAPALGRIILASMCLSLSLSLTGAPQAATPTEIELAIQHFFDAVSKRDAAAAREVLVDRFVGIDTVTEAGNRNARIEFVDTAHDARLLPPEGNDDMTGLQVSSLNVQFSSSNPCVATASFRASKPLTEEQVAQYKRWLSIDSQSFINDTGLSEEAYRAARERIETMVADGQVHHMFLAMLGRRNGEWKIVCMAFPE